MDWKKLRNTSQPTTPMFNLDHAIGEWRQQMHAAGIKTPDVLDELENHLREDIERRTQAGGDPKRMFELAAAQLGEPGALKMELDGAQKAERKNMKRGLMIGGGIIGVMVGMALVMPAMAQYRQMGAMRNEEPWLFLIGSLLTLAGCFATFRSFKKARA